MTVIDWDSLSQAEREEVIRQYRNWGSVERPVARGEPGSCFFCSKPMHLNSWGCWVHDDYLQTANDHDAAVPLGIWRILPK